MTSGALNLIAETFDVTDRVQLTLLTSLYMVGYVLGPLLCGPLSEYIGRRPVLIGTFFGYLVFMLASGGAPNYPALLVFRLLCGINAAAPTTVISGLYSDIIDNPSQRGFAMAVYMTITGCAPLLAPLISGYASQSSWRWPFGVACLIAVPTIPLVLTVPETFAPVLRNRHMKKRLEDGEADERAVETSEARPFDVQKIFLRPFTLLFTEPILLSSALYLTLAYSVYFMMFQAYPIIFHGQCFYSKRRK